MTHARKGCSFEGGCNRDHYANGLCESHNRQAWRGKELTPIKPLTPGQEQRREKQKQAAAAAKVAVAERPRRPLKKGDDAMTRIVRAVDYEMKVTPLSEEMLERARQVLARNDAMDLAEMLGVAQATETVQTDEHAVR